MTEHVGTVTKSISDFGMMAVTAAFFLILSASLWIVIFKWFKKIIDDLIQSTKSMMTDLLAETRKQNVMLNVISEGLLPETLLRVKNVSNTFFDLAVFRILGLIKRLKKENHIDDRPNTMQKIRKSVTNLHADRKSKLDAFRYRGKMLSEYVNPEWIETVTDVVEKEVYDPEPNDERAYTNVKNAYDGIKLDFYERLNRN